jgi:uncharacterized integral membrane protein
MNEYWNNLTSGQKSKLVMKVMIGLLAFIFAIRNWQSVPVILVFFKTQIPLTLVIILCVGIGFAVSSLFDHRKFKAKDKEITDLKTKIASMIEVKKEVQ